MSRVGKQQIMIPAGVVAEVQPGLVKIKGPKGELQRIIDKRVTVNLTDGVLTCDVKNKENKTERALWGTFASHLKNMVIGVTQGFKKQLEINGVGYKVAMQGTDLKLEVGFSHSVIFKIPTGIKATVEKNQIALEGIDKELLGKTAAELRAVKKPEPYKGKGIKYLDEVVRRKAGKAVKGGS
ncbi:MAG: 50S ribosomal protein L6 [Candidatus Magasanikbacteria bacterium GW2011_GWC2_37_14]|uniref:Large ribosomal subunit protein uL6 n=1 Tax=Candidatus Magasanikbacteria bacterium GW2011_GWC2_37_14 TaxID=1619046 RepID=A0A0G0ISL1_9BACT|nr:MAG: 50S ribosomal protein L6 [Candidatus Magasanikbacteria bacterium GW2011_GWC2_37_14]